jgi:transcriptional regulator with PAS, ATPase and Fis domain
LDPYPLTPLVGEMIRFILSGKCESLVLINKNGQIEFMDQYAEKFFNLQRGQAKGLHITKLVPDSGLHLVAQTGVAEIGKLVEVKGERRITTRFPIRKNGNIIGAIGKIVFYRLEEIENLSKEINSLKIKINYYKRGFKEFSSSKYNLDDIIGESKQFLIAKHLTMKAALTDANILLNGESGTGKELFSHCIHSLSSRRNNPFIRVNSPAIPFDLAESELFGYEKGAFSGARSDGKPGKFELCDGGTIFLDEISCLPLGIQSKLLRVLEEKEIEKLGGRNPIKLDFRLIATTNVDLEELVKVGRFRADLFYRLNSLRINIPPLRERKEDIPLYISYYLKRINRSFGTNIKAVSDDALQRMMNYNWPGNVRELVNALEQSVLNVAEGHVILLENLPPFLASKQS